MKRTTVAALLTLTAVLAHAAPSMKRALETGDVAAVGALLDQGADVNGLIGLSDMTPLKIAVKGRRLELARALVERGADVNIRRNGTSALSLACIGGDLAMAEFLLSKGAEVTPRDLAWATGADKETLVARLKAAADAQAAAVKAAKGPSAPSAAPQSRVDEPAYKRAERPDDFALLISVEKPLDGPAAAYAERDADAVRRHLVALGWPERNVLVLAGERAGRAGLAKYVEKWLPNNVTSASRFFFYFAGNGASDPKTGKAYLLPWDGDPAMLETTGYPLDRLWQNLGGLKTRGSVALVDAGFSGAGERSAAEPGRKEPATKLDPAARELGGLAAVLAVSAGEAAGSEGAQKHGLLTYAFLKALADAEAADGAAAHPPTIKGLFSAARETVAAAAKAQGRTQTPQLLTGPLGEGDLSFR